MKNPGNGFQATVTFVGSRTRLLAIMFSGYFLMLLTVGIYRFWLVTNKRRFYWSHTKIDGDALEYTGSAMQLLIGFLFAVMIFIPLYGFFFYLSTQSPETAIIGYSGAAIFMYFMYGYAAFRSRRFLLSRTLWRGIRFQLTGSAWSYAFRRLFWTVLTFLTLGLAFPFMSVSLWKYRYSHTWFGDRQCSFSGSWRQIAIPFYLYYFMVAGLILLGFNTNIATSPDSGLSANNYELSPEASSIYSAAIMVAIIAYFHLRAYITSAMLSSISIGKTRLKVTVRTRDLSWLQIAYSFVLAIVAVGFGLIVAYLMGDVFAPMLQDDGADLGQVLQMGWYNLIVFGGIYLGFMASISIVSEIILKLGFWRLVARGTVLENAGDLQDIRAGGQESPLVGEGLADALNAGAY
ncbi:MAG: DUF898 domain-containing protein [Devosiaceae bacterium]|nr:DUF898 domain-containing protein [Devosiaceae bacterium]